MQSTYKQTTARVHTHAETAADYALADYQGDIKKVLLTEAKLLPGTDFLSEGEGQLSGGVVYDVVYADTEGAMCSVQLSSDYDMTVPAPGTPAVPMEASVAVSTTVSIWPMVRVTP